MTESDKPIERNFAMNNPILSWLAAMVLSSGSVLLASAAEPAPQTQPAAPATVRADAPKLP